MHLIPRQFRRTLQRTAITTACLGALSLAHPVASGSSVTVSVNLWLGASAERSGSNTDWFNAANWFAGPLFGLPDEIFPVDIGPSQIIVNGIPTDSFNLPASEAVLGGSFSMSRLYMRAWDGISQIRLTNGGLLTTSANIGGVNSAYQPTLPLQKATLVLDGGQLAGSWIFHAHSRVIVLGQYSQAQGSWGGNLDELVIGAGASFNAGTGAVIGRVVNDGALSVGASQTLTLAGNLVNNGTLDLRGSGTQAAVLQLSQDTVLSGNGQTVLGGRGNSFIGNSDNAAKTLTIAAGHTVRGSGMLGGGRYSQYFRDFINVVNQGTVRAEGADGIGIMANSFDNRAGTVEVGDGSRLDLIAIGPLTGGTLQSLGAATLGGSGTFESVTLRGGFNLAAGRFVDVTLHDSNTVTGSTASRQTIEVGGSLTNLGTLTIRGGSTANESATMAMFSDTTLSGSGQTVLGGRSSSFIGNSDNAAKTLTIAAGHTVRGSGMLGGGRYSQYFRDFINVVNQGTVRAEGDGGIGIMANSFDNRAGTVEVGDSSRLDLIAIGPLTGGMLQSLGAATLGGSGTFESVTLRGGFQLAGGSYTDATLHDTNTVTGSTAERQTIGVGGTLVNHGILTIRGGSSANEAATMQLLSNTTLSGSGQTVLGGRSSSFIGNSDNAAKTLTIAAGHTVRGSGMLGGGRYSQYFRDMISVVNQGRILVEGADGIGMIASGFENQGLLQVSTGSALEAVPVDGGIRQTAAGAVTQVDGRLATQTLWLEAGTLKGSGLVQANVVATGGTVAPGNSPGKLSIQGNLTLAEGSLLLLEVTGPLQGSQYDWLDVSGQVTLDGTLRIVFDGYTPQLGERFSFLTSGTGSFAGAFDRLETPGFTVHLTQGGQALSFTVDTITPVPEPASWALLLLGAAGLGAWVRRRQATQG